MTENLSFYEGDRSPKIPQLSMIDMIAQSNWQDFYDEAKMVELFVSDYDPNDDDACMEVGRHMTDLNGMLGYDYQGARSKVVGMGYSNYSKGSQSNECEPFYIDTEDASYFGVNICFVNGKWQTMLEFECHDDTNELPQGMYNVPLDSHHLIIFSIDTRVRGEDDVVLKQKFITDYHDQYSLVYSSKFTSASAKTQRSLLSKAIADVDNNVPHEMRNEDVAIECTQYYTAYDDMHYATYDDTRAGFDLRDFSTDLSEQPSDERLALMGRIIGFEYPELKLLPPDYELSGGALDMNDGMYCLVLRNKKEAVTHYILPQTITEIN